MPRARRKGFVIIQIERPGETLAMDDAVSMLADTGLELDRSYGPIPVNPKLGRFVVRGSGDAGARARAAEIPGVTLFADARIKPT
ncbi:MAG TPA: hypothetical protein VJY35_05925 [Candidatus Eisenbacteria bacterium]|nr:hypothetical protein [Candidatus Eisenbacteria bacterium]